MKNLTQKRLTFSFLTVLFSTSTFAAKDNTTLSSVVVTANNTPQSAHSVTANMSVITQAEIEEKQYKTLDQALRQVPGISFTRNGGIGKATSVLMRGDSSKRILVLQDGVELNDPTSVAGASFENINLDDVERIEIIKGPQSGIWGSGAMAGVINIITKQGGNKASVNFEAGSYGYKKLATTLGAGNDKVDFVFNYSALDQDGFTTIKPYQESVDGYETDAYSQQDTSFKLGLTPSENHRFQLFIKNTTANNQYDSDFPAGNPDDAFSESSYDRQIKQLSYSAQVADFSPKIYAQQSKVQTTYNDGQQDKIGAQLKWDYFDDQQVTFFADKRFMQNKNDSTNNYDNTGYGLTATNQLFDQRWILTASLRQDEFSTFDNETTGKIGTRFFVTPDVYLSANYGTAYRTPSLAEVAYTAPTAPDLIPESKESYDVTLGAYGFEITYYDAEIKNEIDYNLNTFTYENLEGKSKYEGVEASYKVEIKAINTDLSLNYTQQTAKNSDDESLLRRPEQQYGFSLDNYSINDVHLGLISQYTGTMYDQDDKQGAQIGEYWVTDITADYQINSHLNLYGKVENLFNEDFTTAVASPRDSRTPTYVYANGGTQVFVGIRGKL